MHSIDRVLIDPEDALFDAVHAAIAAIDRDMDALGHELGCDPDEATSVLARRMRQEPEGVCEWRIPGPGPNGVRAALIAVWWSDFFERRRLRLLGGCHHRGMELPLPIPSAHRPALACVYPEVCVVASQHRRPRLLTVCECGAWGEPGKLAWMGPTCGPCWDRLEAEAARQVTLEVGSGVHSLAFAPDGRLAISTDDGKVGLWDLESMEQQGTWQVPPGKIAFGTDGRHLGCLTHLQRTFYLLETDQPAGWSHHLPDEVLAFAPALEPDQFFFQLSPQEVIRGVPGLEWDWDLGAPDYVFRLFRAGEPLCMPYPLRCDALAVSPDGRVVAAACGGQGLCFWDAYTGEPLHRSTERDCTGPLLWSPDGTALACGVEAVHWKAILYDFYARRRRAVIGGTDPLHALAFTPDGRWLLTCERNLVRAWGVETGMERYGVAPAADQPYALTLSPDGEAAALAVRGGRVKLWPTRLLLPEA